VIQTNNPQPQSQNENKRFASQMKITFEAFQKQPKTMFMVEVETGINRANICRYIAKWEKQNLIYLAKFDLCKISKYRAGYYTTDKNFIKISLQLTLI
jgi:hypothetical protein